MKKSKVALSLEAVSFQSDLKFFTELTAFYSELFARSEKEKIAIVDLQPLAGIIKSHTNITVDLVDSEQDCYDAYTLTPDIDANCPTAVAIYRWFRVSEDGLRKISKARQALGGFVDLNSGKVGGFFADFKVPLCIGMGWFNGRKYMSPEQLAAMTLHEVGHIFTDFEILSEACTVNCIMQAMAQDWLLSDRVKRTKLLDAATEAANMSIDSRTRDSLVSYDNADNVVTVLLSPDVFTPRSVFGTMALDDTTCEALADQYAARMGAGDYLGKALSEFYKRADIFTLKTKGAALIANIGVLLSMTAAVTDTAAGFWGAGAIIAVCGIMASVSGSDEVFGDVYDTPRNRLRRLALEARGTLKNTKVSPEYVKRVIENLNDLEKSIDRFSNSNRVLEGIVNTVWRSRGRLVDIRRRQELIESLGNNVLFQTAAQLRNR